MKVQRTIMRATLAAALAAGFTLPAAAGSRTATVIVHASVVHHCAVVNPPNSNGKPGVNCSTAAATISSSSKDVKDAKDDTNSVHIVADAKSGVTTINF